MPSRQIAVKPAPPGFGTFSGVFTPCTLTILGVIMFLRFGKVVSNAGVWHALLIVLACKAITTLTALSLSAVATNTRVQAGGAYFLISRSLGVEFGGAIGLVFFSAQAISVSMYVIGFSEALLASGSPGLPMWQLASLVNLAVCVCVYIGAGWTIKLQYAIFALLIASLGSFGWGAFAAFDGQRLQAAMASAYPAGQGFFTSFALFFPAATGIMAGANMSGDLRDPSRSIPRGTLLSIAVTGVIYLGLAVLLGAAGDPDELASDPLVMARIARWPLLIALGVYAATLSSALGSMMGAPRILQALASDDVFRRLRYFARLSGKAGEPRRAIVLTFVISQLAILLGNLDAIAPIITMFFMITYGYLNLATFYESVTGNPSYRPRFRYTHWATSLAGALGCGVVMLLISWPAALAAIAVMVALQWVIGRADISDAWGEDVQHGAAFQAARRALLRLEDAPYHPKSWRPSILALSGGGHSRVHLAVWGHWLTGGRGLLTLGQVVPASQGQQLSQRAAREQRLRRFIREHDLSAFPAVVVSSDLTTGVSALIQCCGIGLMRPNLLLLGWSDDPDRQEEFCNTLRTAERLGLSVAVLRASAATEERPWSAGLGSIDVWWRGKANGPLMLLLAHLLQLSDTWRRRPLRLLRAIPSPAGIDESHTHLRLLGEEARIDVEPQIRVTEDAPAEIQHMSRTAAVTILGFQPPGDEPESAEAFLARTISLMEGLGTVLLIHSAGDMALEA